MSGRTPPVDLSVKPHRAIVCGILAGVPEDAEVSLDELVLLLDNLNIPTEARVVQRRKVPNPSSFIGSGKAEEIKDFARKSGVTLLVIDGLLTPTQKNSLQNITSLVVWDRAFVIMKIFESRAHTAEAKLQVELAQCRYEIPGLKGLGHQMSRLGGGIGTRGPGETEFERHRRKLERRIKNITAKLEGVRKRRKERRDRRKKYGAFTVALVGYTNSGKSTLLRGLSKDFGIYTADQLFSTLDTVVRRINFKNGGSFLLSDTVGFIRNLPPDLTAAFRATLEEISRADLILLVVDTADKDPVGNADIVLDTLRELKADGLPRVLVLNKIDKAGSDADFISMELRARGEETVKICALTGDGFEDLLDVVKKYALENSCWGSKAIC